MSEIRRQARQRRIQIGLELDTPTPAEAVLDACLSAMGQDRAFVPNPPFEAAHALAHLWLHSGLALCVGANWNPAETIETPGSALSKVDGGSHSQKCEAEANLFAAELLLPGPLALSLFWEQALPSEAIASLLGLPIELVEWQMAEALLLPPLSESPGEEARTPTPAAVPLDKSQQAAAEAECGPLLLGAGPGTGKTKTLVGRCQFLTQKQGIAANKILALTFSRKAAQEMQERLLAAGVGDKKSRPWVGTFHAFSLGVLRRFGGKIGLVGEIKLLDALDAVTLLENHLAELNLETLDNLYDPAQHLGGILRQISRAKDERCSPENYAEFCRAMLMSAQADAEALAARTDKVLKREQEQAAKGLENAAKAVEVAHCYGVYERLLLENGFLDFGGLIGRTIELLETHPDVLAILQAEYPQVLADEYQDVNRACAYLVKLLAGDDARGLWAVGDHRQSIYQFQGASPANVAAFERDYPAGRRLELGVNYRSRRPIVDLFAEAAQSDGKAFAGWQAHRGDAEAETYPAVIVAIAPDMGGQALGIAEAIQDLQAAGWNYRDQAILCRTHSQAGSLAEMLSAQDIPVLSLGPLLDRPEVKDLLCLLSLMTDFGGSALMCVASWPEYAVPHSETLALLARMRRDKTPLLDALQDAELHPGLGRLGRHLAELGAAKDDPAARLRHYLFGQSQYLRELLQSEPRPFVQIGKKLAIHQLLALADGFDRRLVVPKSQAGPPGTVRDFLAHLRRLSAAGAAPRVSLPPEAEALDAVRLLTAHAAKGLEFPVVFVPNLGAGQFPTRGRHDGIPEPPGLVGSPEGQEMDEEQCLFFVALSRAQDHLILSRSETSGSERTVAPSPLLALLQPHSETAWGTGREPAAETPAPDDLTPTAQALPEYFLSDLETYARCPRQYYYAKMLHLSGLFQDGGYPQFHACVRRTLEWREDAQAGGAAVSDEELAAKFESVWAEFGPVGHLHEAKYKASAAQMLQSAALLSLETERKTDTRTLWATLSNCRVAVRPDVLRLDTSDGALVVARRLTGKPGKDDHTDKRLALYRRAAQETHPEKPLRLALHYLADGGLSVPIEAPATKQQIKWEADRIAKYEKAAYGIQMGHFQAEPGDECARCAYNLICPV